MKINETTYTQNSFECFLEVKNSNKFLSKKYTTIFTHNEGKNSPRKCNVYATLDLDFAKPTDKIAEIEFYGKNVKVSMERDKKIQWYHELKELLSEVEKRTGVEIIVNQKIKK